MTNIPYTKKVFPNGMKYIFIPQPQSLATTVLILVSTGSEYEEKEISGLSHFLEHLCFKGTKKRPIPSLISEELDSLGAEYNAFTGNEITGYFAKSANKNFPKILDVVSDLYLNPLIDQEEMDKEKGVIIEEINMYEDLPMRKVRDDLAFLMYGDTPAGRSIAGTKDTIKNMTRDDILSYRNIHYIAPKTTVVVAGGLSVNPEAVIAEYFAGIGTGEVIKKNNNIINQSAPQIFVRDKDTDQTHLAIGIKAFNLFDDRRYALSLMSGILGGSMSSRLFKKIREEMGAAYYIRSSSELSSDYGLLSISSGVDKDRLVEIIKVILAELKLLKNNLVSEEELNRVKEYISGKLILQLETSDDVAEFYGAEEALMGGIRTPEEILEKIKNVTSNDILKVANDILKEDGLNLAIIGSISSEVKEELRRVFNLS